MKRQISTEYVEGALESVKEEVIPFCLDVANNHRLLVSVCTKTEV